MSIITVGIDLAKNIFAVHGADEDGKAALVKLVADIEKWMGGLLLRRIGDRRLMAAGVNSPSGPQATLAAPTSFCYGRFLAPCPNWRSRPFADGRGVKYPARKLTLVTCGKRPRPAIEDLNR